MSQRSYGDGRRMSVAEAIERRTRIARVFGCVSRWPGETVRDQDRRWAAYGCTCGRSASKPEDVGLLDGIPVAMCSACRGAAS